MPAGPYSFISVWAGQGLELVAKSMEGREVFLVWPVGLRDSPGCGAYSTTGWVSAEERLGFLCLLHRFVGILRVQIACFGV